MDTWSQLEAVGPKSCMRQLQQIGAWDPAKPSAGGPEISSGYPLSLCFSSPRWTSDGIAHSDGADSFRGRPLGRSSEAARKICRSASIASAILTSAIDSEARGEVLNTTCCEASCLPDGGPLLGIASARIVARNLGGHGVALPSLAYGVWPCTRMVWCRSPVSSREIGFGWPPPS
jgi:hypothetical protein